MAAPDDEEFDLGISLAIVAAIAERARAVQALAAPEPVDDEEEEGEADDDGDEDSEDATAETLPELIEELNEDEQAALIALVWTGRGDYGPEEWEEALRLAAERNEAGGTAAYLLGVDMLGDLLAEGAAAFGFSLEEYEP